MGHARRDSFRGDRAAGGRPPKRCGTAEDERSEEWLGRRDSNPDSTVQEPHVLPLDDVPGTQKRSEKKRARSRAEERATGAGHHPPLRGRDSLQGRPSGARSPPTEIPRSRQGASEASDWRRIDHRDCGEGFASRQTERSEVAAHRDPSLSPRSKRSERLAQDRSPRLRGGIRFKADRAERGRRPPRSLALAKEQAERATGGEGGIRTPGPGSPGQLLSKQPCSTTPAPLR